MPRALIVEDEAISALALTRMTEDAGWVVAGVSPSAEQALELAESVEPDVVLMDIQLSGSLNGVEAARRIVAAQRIPVIFTTAYSVTEVLEVHDVPELFYFIAKSINESTLRDLLARIASVETPARPDPDARG